MNAVFLIVIVLCVFVMGYRFYAKFLVLGVFRPRKDVTTPAHQQADPHDYSACNRWLLLGYHAAASVGLVSITGVGIGVAWGWVPAFLWIVVGTLVAGGIYSLASLWSSLRDGGNSMAGVIFEAAGAWAALPVFLLGVALLVLMCTLTAVLLGQLLQAHPDATWFFLSLAASAWPLRRMLSSHSGLARLMWVAATTGLLITGMFLGQMFPLSIGGELALDINGDEVLQIPNEAPWVAVALVMAFRSIDAPISAIGRPRGVVVGILLALVMLLTVSGLVLSAPTIVAPEFNVETTLPDLFPLLFLAISAGSISGVTALIATGPTMRQINQHKDASVITFGSAMINGSLAVLVLAVLCAGFSETGEWSSMYGSLPDRADVFAWLDLAVTKMGRFVAALGVPLHLAVTMVAAIVASMALTMLESTLRALSFSVEEFAEDFSVERLRGRKKRARIATGIVVVATGFALQVDLGLNHWLFLGLTNQLFAGTVMLMLSLILFKHSRGMTFVLVPGLFVLICATWGLFWLLLDWWNSGHWALLFMASAGGLLAVATAVAAIKAFVKERRRLGTASASTGAP